MKRFSIYVILTGFLFIWCVGEDKKESVKNCLSSEDLIITNSSEYTIIELFAHNTPDYFNDSSKTSIVQNLLNGASVNFPVEYGDSIYFTFVRRYFSTSSVNIAVTTERPVYIENCYKFTLFLLEDDYYLRKEDNFTY